MTRAEELRTLLARVESAEGYDPALDADLYAVMKGWDAAHRSDDGTVERLRLDRVEGDQRIYIFAHESVDSHDVPMFSDGSLDDAVSFIETALAGWSWSVGLQGGRYRAAVSASSPLRPAPVIAKGAASGGLNLVSAALSALIAREEAEHGR